MIWLKLFSYKQSILFKQLKWLIEHYINTKYVNATYLYIYYVECYMYLINSTHALLIYIDNIMYNVHIGESRAVPTGLQYWLILVSTVFHQTLIITFIWINK